MRIFIVIIFLSLTIFANSLKKQSSVVLCFAFGKEEALEFCQSDNSLVTIFSTQITISDTIRLIQKQIRRETKEKKVILMGKGFMGTLLGVAQTNLIPFYRKNINGLILEDAPPNIFKTCIIEKSREYENICNYVEEFQRELGNLASKMESTIALSPILQMDGYWPKTLVLGKQYLSEWKKAFKDNAVEYIVEASFHKERSLSYFPFKVSHKIQPKSKKYKPDYYGPLVRFHLNKILYKEHNKILEKQDIAYGEDKYQTYDIYLKEESKNNPIMIYVHGGGWHAGDKKNYKNFSKQFADRGFLVANVNYRLLEHPKIGMEEMVNDVQKAIVHILDHSESYEGNTTNVVIVSESAGAQLSYLAVSRLSKEYTIKVNLFNSMISDLRLLSVEKQVYLSDIEEDEKRLTWLDNYSPINHLDKYSVPTFISHSFNDNIVSSKHLDNLSILSVLHYDNIFAYWIESGGHPVLPKHMALQPSYFDIEYESMRFINKNLVDKY